MAGRSLKRKDSGSPSSKRGAGTSVRGAYEVSAQHTTHRVSPRSLSATQVVPSSPGVESSVVVLPKPRLRHRAHSTEPHSHHRGALRQWRRFVCSGWGLLGAFSFLGLITLAALLGLIHNPSLKISARTWSEGASPRFGHAVLSTLESSMSSVQWTTSAGSILGGAAEPRADGVAVRVVGPTERNGSLLSLLWENRRKRPKQWAAQISNVHMALHTTIEVDRRPETIKPPTPEKVHKIDWKKARQKKVALCLIGGARDFQLTGPTLSYHLLRAYPSSHAFVLSPLDDNSHKLSLLATMVPNLVHVRIAPDVPVNESALTDRLLAAIKGGPETPEAQTRQGIIQQFKSVEMCASVISSFEHKHGFLYEWILRTRVDGYWMGPPPPLKVLDAQGYTIPGGSDWGGLNDRLGIGRRNVSLLALRRLSAMNALVQSGFNNLNAERVYLAHMAFMGIDVTRYDFPFCILSRKKGMPAFPVAAALTSTAALNGAKCRPCRATVKGAEAAKYVAALPELVFSSLPHGVDLCLAESHWSADWQDIFDHDAGPERAAVRRYLDTRTFQECVRDWEDLRPLVPIWDAPPPEPLCVRERLGKFRKLGYPGGDFPVFIDAFLPPRVSSRTRNPIVYSVVAGVDFSFDWAILRRLKDLFCRVHAFDSTPAGLRWVAEKFDNLPTSSWVFHPWLIGPSNGLLNVYELELEEHPIEYATRLPPDMDGESVPPPMAVEARTLEYTMKLLNHSWIDILRIGGHMSLHEDIFASWIQRKITPPICQVIVSFHRGDKHYGSQDLKTRKELLDLRALGYELGACLRKDVFYESCVFFSVDACDYDV